MWPLSAGREKWPADKRNEDPLLFSTHPDFVTFPPDGPLRQLSIPQMRVLKERAQFLPSHGDRRVFLIDHIDRSGDQAANSLLKILEEPPPYLVLIATAENAYDLLPTIRSRAVHVSVFAAFGGAHAANLRQAAKLDDAERRLALAAGSPGLALSLDLEAYTKRRAAMLLLLEVAAGSKPFAAWIPVSETIGRSKNEKLEIYLKLIYELLRDLLLMAQGRESDIRNKDLKRELAALVREVSGGAHRQGGSQSGCAGRSGAPQHSEGDRARQPHSGTAGSGRGFLEELIELRETRLKRLRHSR